MSTREICWELGVTETSFYNWKAKYGGLEISDVKKMKSL
ncbi:MAG: transposase, partial [Sphingobacteriales bacterium]